MQFSFNFDNFLDQNCVRKLYFMLKTPKFAQILRWGAFRASVDNFSEFPSSDSIPDVSPLLLTPSPTGTENRPPESKSPPKNFVKKTLQLSLPSPDLSDQFVG